MRTVPGTPAYRRITLAMFLAGVATFALLYETQALLPLIAAEYGASSAQAGLTVSATTGALAVAILPLSALSERWSRAHLMVGSLAVAGVVGLAASLAPNLSTLLVLRALQGLALAGVPAVGVAYLGERVAPVALGQAVGSYVAGNTVGGLAGRLVPSVLADVGGWRVGMAGLAGAALVVTLVFHLALPAGGAPVRTSAAPSGSSGPSAGAPTVRALVGVAGRHLADPRLRGLYALAFCCMGAFVAVYNYLGFRLVAPPYDIRPAVVGLVYLSYVAGTLSSVVAGRLADAWGRRRVVLTGLAAFGIGVLLTVASPLPMVLVGVVVATAGFFGVHATASGWVAKRATHDRAQASALYLLAYYTGSSVLGWLLGLPFEAGGWTWLVGCVLAVLLAATAVVVGMRRDAA